MRFDCIQKALLIDGILVISDVHIGYEESLNKQGVLVPRHQFEETMADLGRIFNEIGEKKIEIKEIVILGDLKHQIGEILEQEWTDTFKFLEYLLEKCRKIVVVKGQHDVMLEPILHKFPSIKFLDKYISGEIAFIHGNEEIKFDSKIKTIVKGDLHPAITISEGAKREMFKCFLVGKEKGKKIIILPSFLPIVEGSDVSEDERYKNFEVYVVGDKVYKFGKVRDID
jgi:hypothetical protein